MSYFFKGAKVIPIAGAKEDPAMMEQAFESIATTLAAGDLVCFFPEGQITRDGELSPFRPGIERAISRSPVPVIPMVLKGMWGSFFSRKYGGAATKYSVIPKRIWSEVELNIQPAWKAEDTTAKKLEGRVKELLAE